MAKFVLNWSGEHLLSLINDVLQVAKIEAGKERLLETNFDFYALLKSLHDTWQVKAAAKGLEFKVKWKDNIPQYLHAHESKLRQILINLLENALKFTTSGSITLGISRQKQELSGGKIFLHFEVEDSGFGIAPEEIDNLFEAFVQTEVGLQYLKVCLEIY
jgi:signal transduction histidine kinase